MSRELRLKLSLNAIENVTGKLKAITTNSAKMKETLKLAREEQGKLGNVQKTVTGFKNLQAGLGVTSKKLDSAREKVKQMQTAMRQGEGGTATFKKQFTKANIAVRDLSEKLKTQRTALNSQRKALHDAGFSTSKFGDSESALKARIDSVNKSIELQKEKLKALSEQQDRIGKFKSAIGKVGEAGSNVLGNVRSLATRATAAGIAGGYLFKKQFLDRAAQFESYQTILRTVTGSESKAAEAMNWVSDFAAATPFQIDEVLESFTRLKAYGIDPMGDGLLRTLGDTASAMGKPVMQAVEAIADAVTGENERLKEFGIRGSKSKGMITYEYTNAAGDTLKKTVDASNRKLIQSTLAAIWNEKYAGAMRDQSKTWNGMISNMGDQWARFTNMVMGQGLFDRLRDQLRQVLDRVDAMAANGELEAWAKRVGSGMLKFADGVWKIGTALSELTGKVADAVGGWKNFAYLLVALKITPLVLSLFGLVSALWGAGSAALAVTTGSKAFIAVAGTLAGAIRAVGIAMWGLSMTPLFWIIAAVIAVIAGGAYLIWKNWDWLKEKFGGWFSDISARANNFSQGFKDAYEGGLSSLLPWTIKNLGNVGQIILNWSPVGLFHRAMAGVLSYFGIEIPAKFTEFGALLINSLINGITSGFSALKNKIGELGDSSIGWLKEKIAFNPVLNVTDRTSEALTSAKDLAKKIAVAGSGIALAGAASLPVTAGVPNAKDLRNSLASAGSTSSLTLSQLSPVQISKNILTPLALEKGDIEGNKATSNGVRINNPAPVLQKPRQINYQDHGSFNITINPAAGMDARAVATMVQQEMEKEQRKKAARLRSALYDNN